MAINFLINKLLPRNMRETKFLNTISKQFEDDNILDCGIIDGFPWIAVQGRLCPCIYVGLPKGHKYWGMPYDDIPVECNGGLTFSSKLNDWYLIGWDYGHSWNLEGEQTLIDLQLDAAEVISQLHNKVIQSVDRLPNF